VAIIFGSTLLRTGKLLFVVLIIVHVFTCVYWLIKTISAEDRPEEIDLFLSSRQLERTVRALPNVLAHIRTAATLQNSRCTAARYSQKMCL
jgi:hypothetical protein